MTDERDPPSIRALGEMRRPTAVLSPHRQPRTASRRMPIRSLNTQDAHPPIESLRALDWLNFFLAALLMGFGPFVASSLSDRG